MIFLFSLISTSLGCMPLGGMYFGTGLYFDDGWGFGSGFLPGLAGWWPLGGFGSPLGNLGALGTGLSLGWLLGGTSSKQDADVDYHHRHHHYHHYYSQENGHSQHHYQYRTKDSPDYAYGDRRYSNSPYGNRKRKFFIF